MLACSADEIFASESSIVGSIGVIAATFGFQDLIARWGIERRIYTAGESKSLLDPFRPADPVDVSRLRAVQADIHEAFKGIVRESRGARLTGDPDSLFSGAFWTGRQGQEMGLVDGLSDIRTVLRARYGKKVRFRVFEPVRRQRSIWRLGFGSAAQGVSATLDGNGAALDALAGGMMHALEERAWWSRLGL